MNDVDALLEAAAWYEEHALSTRRVDDREALLTEAKSLRRQAAELEEEE